MNSTSLFLYAWIWGWDGGALRLQTRSQLESDALYTISKTSSGPSQVQRTQHTESLNQGEDILAVRPVDSLEKRPCGVGVGVLKFASGSGRDVKGRSFACLHEGWWKSTSDRPSVLLVKLGPSP